MESLQIVSRRFSYAWYAAIHDTRRYSGSWSDLSGPRVPVVPWITPPIVPAVRNFFRRMGEIREFDPGDWLYPHVQVRSFMYVESGITGRILASLDGQSGAGAMALSPPGRYASGNLNWITGRPAIGRYQALSHVRVREIRHSEALEYVHALDADQYLKMLAQAELINLSDRMGFAVLALLPAIDRFKALLLGWAIYFGHLSEDEGTMRVTIPIPGRKAHIAQVIRTSGVTLDSILSEMRSNSAYRREGDFVSFEAAALQGIHDWMRHADGEEAFLPRPRRVEDLLLEAEAQDEQVEFLPEEGPETP